MERQPHFTPRRYKLHHDTQHIKQRFASVKGKRPPRQLSAPPSSNGNDGRRQVSLNATVSPNPAPVKSFQLYSVFATSPLADELFVKVSKSVCVSLSTKTAYSTSINGYLVIL